MRPRRDEHRDSGVVRRTDVGRPAVHRGLPSVPQGRLLSRPPHSLSPPRRIDIASPYRAVSVTTRAPTKMTRSVDPLKYPGLY
jgi:hypothetical protein